MKSPGETIIYDVRASYAGKDVVSAHGGTALMNKVGHAFIKRRMREENAVFGGEVTGHYYFRDFFFADNGFIPALLILELMSRKGQTLAELLAPLRAKYFISGEINTKVASMDLIDGRLKALAARYPDAHTYAIDGFSAEFPDWHFNVRRQTPAVDSPQPRRPDAAPHEAKGRSARDYSRVIRSACISDCRFLL